MEEVEETMGGGSTNAPVKRSLAVSMLRRNIARYKKALCRTLLA